MEDNNLTLLSECPAIWLEINDLHIIREAFKKHKFDICPLTPPPTVTNVNFSMLP